jgi:hypothetical protein
MAVHDRAFIPILAGACMLLVGLIGLHHHGLAAIITDVMVTIYALLVTLAGRCALLLTQLRPQMVHEAA